MQINKKYVNLIKYGHIYKILTIVLDFRVKINAIS